MEYLNSMNRNMSKVFGCVVLLGLLSACGFEMPQLDTTAKFDKQHFVTSVSMIEVYKLRNGKYPDTLQDLEYLGDWDAIWIAGVRYEPNPPGYNLFVDSQMSALTKTKTKIEFPVTFKQGLGIKDTNIEWLTP